jgi:putative Mg2+ transporter-C (MgtC) family protein
MGFYGAAVGSSLIATIFMMWGGKIEDFLPVRHAVLVTLQFDKYVSIADVEVFRLIRSQGYDVADGSFSIKQNDDKLEWRFVAVSQGKRKGASLIKLSDCLKFAEGIQDFHLSYARN